MENSSPFDSFELQLTVAAQGFLRETAKWARFLSIIGFIAMFFLLLAGLFFMAAGSAMGSETAGMGAMAAFPGSILGIIYIVMAILYFFPFYYLYKFASKTKSAFAGNDTVQLTEGFENLKSHYKFMGILTIVMIVLYIVAIIGGIAAAATMI